MTGRTINLHSAPLGGYHTHNFRYKINTLGAARVGRFERLTAKEIKQINKEISRLRSKAIRLESEAFKITPALSDTPGAGGTSDKVGNAVSQITDIQREIQNLEILRNSALNRLSRDIFEENCLFMHYGLHYSWQKIASTIGRTDAVESIKKTCYRYHW